MVCTANDLLEWKDFPKGLKVLLLDEDRNSAAEIKSKLEEMEYIVSTFFNENEALLAVSSKSENFHVAIVEVSLDNSHGRFKFLETAEELPTIMMSSVQCLNIMMKCIALGAVEFLRKPLSVEKLKNIWQHVVHKAFNAGGSICSESLKSIKDSLISVLQLQQESGDVKNEASEEQASVAEVKESDGDQPASIDKFPAPSTPQIKQGERLLDEGDYQDHNSSLVDKEIGENDAVTKFVETTIITSAAENIEEPTQISADTVIKEEDDCTDSSKGVSNLCCRPPKKEGADNLGSGDRKLNKDSSISNSCGAKINRKKPKVDWTPGLHKKFVQAVEQLGVDQAIPSRILELMKVEGLTRHNVASHLQKYRLHRRHILPKEEERRWPHPQDPTQRSYSPLKPVMAFPPYHSNHTFQVRQVYPVWGQPGNQPPSIHMWSPPGYLWQPMAYPGVHADAWGCPVMPPPQPQSSAFPQYIAGSFGMPHNSADFLPGEEVIDKAVKEAISKPWLPLPIGLKPPSTEGVLAELSRQGISTVPRHINGHHPC
ncbi:hypothetical protein Nepgr_024452 [Nepenthes gracilis]|uniref:Two-component response regulator-like APRR2 n=1 Tax=Nepenthes gracilis TaxID=150966 RepID=A0AAD3T582_NEPGR|nr:hypothetical protein Nepgr_024452 [Nepenthes gracilis]